MEYKRHEVTYLGSCGWKAVEAKPEIGSNSQSSAFLIASEEEAKVLRATSKSFSTIYSISLYLSATNMEP